MTISRNLVPNPSFELSTSGWAASGGSLDRSTLSAMVGREGAALAQATATEGASFLIIAASTLTGDRLLVAAGQTAGVRGWVATDNAMEVRAGILWFDAAGGSLGEAASSYLQARFYGGATLEYAAVAPDGAASFAVRFVARAAPSGTLPAGRRLWLDGVRVPAPNQSSVESMMVDLSNGYRDGSTPGWVWDGGANSSASRGPLASYTPEVELLLAGARVDWIDLIPGFEESVQSQSTVQASPLAAGTKRWVTVRPATRSTGRVTMHFVRETGAGLPGARALAVRNSLATGAPHVLRFYDALAGLTSLTLVPVGEIRRFRAAGSPEAWTIEFDYDMAA